MRSLIKGRHILEGMTKATTETETKGNSLIKLKSNPSFPWFSECEETLGICSVLLTIGSILMVMATLPFSLFYTVKVVQVIMIVRTRFCA